MRPFFMALEQSPVAVMISDRKGVIEYVNPGFRRMTGLTYEEIVGTRWECPLGCAPERCAGICRAVEAETEWTGEIQSRRKNGEAYWESVRVSPVRDDAGTVTHFLWLREDITERKRDAEALARTTDLLETVFANTHLLIAYLDKDFTFIKVNKAYASADGREPGFFVGKHHFSLYPNEENEAIFRRVVETGEPFSIHGKPFTYLTAPERGVTYWDWSLEPVFEPDGSVGGLILSLKDVTKRMRAEEELLRYRRRLEVMVAERTAQNAELREEIRQRREAEAALQESEERFRQLFEQNEEAVLLFQAGTARILDANPAAEALYGHTRAELVARGPSLFVKPENHGEFEEAIVGIGEGAGLDVERMTLAGRDGREIIVSVRGHAIKLKEGRVAHLTFRDIMEKVRFEEEARLKQAQLIHANRMATLGMIVSGVAHEINNPNNLVMFNVPLLQAAWQDAAAVLEEYGRTQGGFSLGGLPYAEMREVVPRLLDGLTDASQRIKGIVGNLKTFARQDRSHPEDPVDVNEAVRTAVAILNHEIMRRTRRFQAAYGSGLPPVRGSARQLEQVVINLLTNALQALPDPGRAVRVTTALSRPEGFVEICVEDEGIGMPREVLDRITEPFFSTRLDAGGLGLGLSICREIVKEHGGSLAFESEPGKGTTARVLLTHEAAAGEGSKVSVAGVTEGGPR